MTLALFPSGLSCQNGEDRLAELTGRIIIEYPPGRPELAVFRGTHQKSRLPLANQGARHIRPRSPVSPVVTRGEEPYSSRTACQDEKPRNKKPASSPASPARIVAIALTTSLLIQCNPPKCSALAPQ